ncbi:hypothetical protein BCV69DRAFT_149462 [Microstroma glucosiphilum]|uniref:F-box domain-containing protein n=1 Tax=Pseudomicrostroma glucosiphilum TaxID=1684307 RepID=A0A316UDZ3_9BASI|nr:hypothetical protein BCV69DRAFT_149462 [Pseudomicrostroma glucosiphilum]PWN22571.1 hypothetical protein BCV69DRAFT_149462 [Pseudomicrostroma glucosiphilum]
MVRASLHLVSPSAMSVFHLPFHPHPTNPPLLTRHRLTRLSELLPHFTPHRRSMAEEVDAAAEAANVGFDQLPDEIVVQILIYSDNPGSFGRASKRVYDLSQSCHTRAQYFLRKHGKGLALFYAISRTKIFTEDLFRTLLNSGATLSLALAQELAIRNFKTTPTRHYSAYGDEATKWGKYADLQAVLAVLAEAHKTVSRLLVCLRNESLNIVTLS